ncbi:MAG TPA: hypothetical protein VJ552_09175 [Sediminibacterium sp.]|nr:hypothetical protein [Sediminibacterium sp.]
MKKIIFAGFFLLSVIATEKLSAQVSVQVNIGKQPSWGPVGYDYVDYYYLPDYQVYYHVPRQQFIYLNGNQWVFAASLPARFGRVDLFNTYKVVINQPRPYLHHPDYYARYDRGHGWSPQPQIIIRDRYNDRHDDRYYRDDRDRHDNGRGNAYGHYKGNHGNGNRGEGRGHGKHGDRD